ncbi:MAG: hypothetical protein SOY06_08520 [Prevotella sp.]|nr:hypothetical protein [Bacteroidales bacterium]MDY4229872.1 hypothetical protein [Prevotella sp.]
MVVALAVVHKAFYLIAGEIEILARQTEAFFVDGGQESIVAFGITVTIVIEICDIVLAEKSLIVADFGIRAKVAHEVKIFNDAPLEDICSDNEA